MLTEQKLNKTDNRLSNVVGKPFERYVFHTVLEAHRKIIRCPLTCYFKISDISPWLGAFVLLSLILQAFMVLCLQSCKEPSNDGSLRIIFKEGFPTLRDFVNSPCHPAVVAKYQSALIHCIYPALSISLFEKY